MHVALRVDGGPEIGFGHLIRSGALAEELLTCDHTLTVATTTPTTVASTFPDAVEIVELPSRDDPTPFVDWLETETPDVGFIDAYPVDTEYQRAVRSRVPLAVLQDDDRHAVCADLFINGNLYAADLDYQFVGHKPTTCLGTDYVLLRREIRDRAAEQPVWRETPTRAIIIMGGSDTANLTPTVVGAFDAVDLHVDAVVGPGCSEPQYREIRRAATNSSADVSVTRDPDNLVELMRQADIAVSTASTTVYELLALGTPIVSIPVIENQNQIAAALQRRDAATVLQRDSDEEAFRTAVQNYIENTQLRRNQQKYGRELVDGNVVKRVVAELSHMGWDKCISPKITNKERMPRCIVCSLPTTPQTNGEDDRKARCQPYIELADGEPSVRVSPVPGVCICRLSSLRQTSRNRDIQFFDGFNKAIERNNVSIAPHNISNSTDPYDIECQV